MPEAQFRILAARDPMPGPSLASARVGQRVITAADVMVGALAVYNVDFNDYAGNGRDPKVVECRMVSWEAMRRLTYESYPQIARLCRRPNHSTIITAVERFRRLVGDEHRADLVAALGRVMDKTVEIVEEECRRLREQRAAEALHAERMARDGAA